MRTTFTVPACAALIGLLVISQGAFAQQKTARQCNDEWKAGQAGFQASGKNRRTFLAECRGLPSPADPVTLGKGQFATEAEARAGCASDPVVWVNLRSKIYHGSDSRSFGATKQGAFMCQKESVASGFRPSAGAARNARDTAS
jgi:hypothetical protein